MSFAVAKSELLAESTPSVSATTARRPRISGGRSFVAATLADARAAFARVAADIGTQYSLGYYPTNKARDGKFRTIKLEVKGVKEKAQIRARDGYYAPKQ